MPAVARELSIEYTPVGGATTVVGGASSVYLLHDKIRIRKAYPPARSFVEATVVVVCAGALAGQEAEFASNVAALETAFTTPRGKVVVKQGATTLVSWDPSANTGFNADPTIEKTGSPMDTGRSRVYTIRVEVDTPATLTGQAGRIDSEIEITFTPSRKRHLRITGSYTALAANSATTQYLAQINTYVGAVQTAVAGSTPWKKISQSYTKGETDAILHFSHESSELIFSEKDGAGVLADPDLIQPTLRVSRREIAPGDSFTLGSVVRLTEVVAVYESAVDATVTTDLRGKYDNAIRAWIIKTVTTDVPGVVALVDEAPDFDHVENRITATLRFLVAGGGKILSCTVTTTDERDFGVILTSVWADDPTTKNRDQGPETRIRTITKVRRKIKSAGSSDAGVPSADDSDSEGQGQFGVFGIGAQLEWNFVGAGDGIPRGNGAVQGGQGGGGGGDKFSLPGVAILKTIKSATPLRIGLPGYQIDVIDLTDVAVIAFYTEAVGGGSSGGGRTREKRWTQSTGGASGGALGAAIGMAAGGGALGAAGMMAAGGAM